MYRSFSWQEALARRCYVPATLDAAFASWHFARSSAAGSYVCLGLACITPSSLTMPTPTLLAEPSIPSTNMPHFVLPESIPCMTQTPGAVNIQPSFRLQPRLRSHSCKCLGRWNSCLQIHILLHILNKLVLQLATLQ